MEFPFLEESRGMCALKYFPSFTLTLHNKARQLPSKQQPSGFPALTSFPMLTLPPVQPASFGVIPIQQGPAAIELIEQKSFILFQEERPRHSFQIGHWSTGADEHCCIQDAMPLWERTPY